MADPQKQCILVVDDEPSLVRMAARSLEIGGFEVVCAGTGTEALEVLRREDRVAAVLLDHELPDMTGLEVLAQMRQFSTAHVVLSSGYPMDAEAEQLGVFVLHKPYMPTQLIAFMQDILKAS